MSVVDALVPSLFNASSPTQPVIPPRYSSYHHRSLPSSRSPSRTKLAYPDSDRSDTDDCDCDPATVKAVKHNASKRRVSASALLSGLRKEEIQHLLFCPGGSRSAAAAAQQRKIRSYSSSQLTAMSPSAKSANPPPRASLYPSPSSSFTPPPAVFDSDHQTALSVLSNAKLAGPSQSIVSACPVSEICDDKENLHRPRSNSTNSIAKRASFTSSNDGQQPGKSSAHSSRRSSVTYPSSPTTLRASKHRKSRPISLASAASAEHRMHETKEPTSPKRPVSELSSVYGSSVDSHTIPESAQRRVPLADARSNSGYSVSSSAGESPLSINTDLPPQLYHRPVSTAGSATTPRRRSLRESKGSNLDSDAAYLDLPTVAPELVSASSDSTLTATLLASLPVVKIRDFAFPNADPRHVGEPAEIQPIEIPPSSSGHESPWRSGYLSAEGIRGDPSAAILSSSSSSSLSSSFTPPPFGSFGFGNPYHYSHKPGGVASSKDSPRPGEPGWSPQCQHSNESSGPSKSKYSWGFVTDNSSDSTPYGQENNESAFSNTTQRDFRGDQGIPSILMGSGLSTSEFHEFDDGNEDEEGADGSDFDASNQQGVQIPTGGLLYRAAYPFTAEAPQEMNLREGDLVRVYEQLCDGWVVAGKVQFDPDHAEEEVETGLIPQNYITLLQQEVTPAAGIQSEDNRES